MRLGFHSRQAVRSAVALWPGQHTTFQAGLVSLAGGRVGEFCM